MKFVFFLLLSLSASTPSVCALDRAATVTAKFGQRVRYSGTRLRYREFVVQFAERTEHRLTGTRLSAVSYRFDVLGENGEKITDFTFTMSGLTDTTMGFSVGGTVFVAEMFYTTAGQPLREARSPKVEGQIPDGEIIVWDESTARVQNPCLLEAFERFGANQVPEPTSGSVTPRADARVAPPPPVAHL